MTNTNRKNLFINHDIKLETPEGLEYENYECSINVDNLSSYLSDKFDINTDKMTLKEIKSKYPEQYESFTENLTLEEIYEYPLMNFYYSFPEYVHFKDSDKEKLRGTNTTLFYNMQAKNWNLALTGGGMDLNPNLLNAFFILGHGIPVNFLSSSSITRNYSAGVDIYTHEENCEKLAIILTSYASTLLINATRLSDKIKNQNIINRHIKGLISFIDKELYK